jgi:hypothetical protein
VFLVATSASHAYFCASRRSCRTGRIHKKWNRLCWGPANRTAAAISRAGRDVREPLAILQATDETHYYKIRCDHSWNCHPVLDRGRARRRRPRHVRGERPRRQPVWSGGPQRGGGLSRPRHGLRRPSAGRALLPGFARDALRGEPLFLLMRARCQQEFIPMDDANRGAGRELSRPALDDLDRCVDTCTRRLASKDPDPALYFYRGWAWMAKAYVRSMTRDLLAAGRDAKRGKKDLEKYLEANPNDPTAIGMLGAFLYFADTIPGAFKLISRLSDASLRRQSPGDWSTSMRRARRRAARDRLEAHPLQRVLLLRRPFRGGARRAAPDGRSPPRIRANRDPPRRVAAVRPHARRAQRRTRGHDGQPDLQGSAP